MTALGVRRFGQMGIERFHSNRTLCWNIRLPSPGWQISPDPSKQNLSLPHPTDAALLSTPARLTSPGYSYSPTRRDGVNNIMNYGSQANYDPAFSGPKIISAAQYEHQAAHEKWVGTVTEFESQLVDADFVSNVGDAELDGGAATKPCGERGE